MSEPSPTARAARSVARKVLPARARSFLRTSWRELPHWAHDLPIDFREWITRSPGRIPPAWLRSHVSLTSSRAEFLDVGRQLAADALRAYRKVRPEGDYGTMARFRLRRRPDRRASEAGGNRGSLRRGPRPRRHPLAAAQVRKRILSNLVETAAAAVSGRHVRRGDRGLHLHPHERGGAILLARGAGEGAEAGRPPRGLDARPRGSW